MSSKREVVEYICDQMREAGEITFKNMFGEFGIYCNGKFFAVVCDNLLFFKPTEIGKKLLPEGKMEPPYKGAKPYLLVEDIDDRELLTKLTQETCKELPELKAKK